MTLEQAELKAVRAERDGLDIENRILVGRVRQLKREAEALKAENEKLRARLKLEEAQA